MKAGVPMWALAFLPLSPDSEHWKYLDFGKGAKTKYEFSEGILNVEANASSGIFLYVFEKPKAIKKIFVNGEAIANPNINSKEEVDDFPLRIGPVWSGDRRLSWVEKKFADNWLVELEQLADSKGAGLKTIDLGLLAWTGSPKWNQREHPMSSYFNETVMGRLDAPGKFEFEMNYTDGFEAVAIWIGSDSDQSKSYFKMKINKIGYE